MSDGATPTALVRYLLGFVCATVGAFPILSAFDVGPFHPDSINGPPWLGVVAGGIFLLGALVVWTHEATLRRPWLGTLFAVALLLAFAAIGNWIAFGVGSRECSGGLAAGAVAGARAAGDLECRAAFGIGALMIDGILLWTLGAGLKQAGVPGRLPGWIEKLGQGVLAVALAPIVLLVVALTRGRALVEACVAWARTGAWPRKPPPPGGRAAE